MNYHMSELSKFMVEKSDDEYFETEEGKNIRMLSAQLTLAHVTGMIKFMKPDDREEIDKRTGGSASDMEDLLKSMLDAGI